MQLLLQGKYGSCVYENKEIRGYSSLVTVHLLRLREMTNVGRPFC